MTSQGNFERFLSVPKVSITYPYSLLYSEYPNPICKLRSRSRSKSKIKRGQKRKKREVKSEGKRRGEESGSHGKTKKIHLFMGHAVCCVTRARHG
jgi:hypothetical protein